MKKVYDDELVSLEKFEKTGLLQEINRRVLHPAGFNLELSPCVKITKSTPGDGGYIYEKVNSVFVEKVEKLIEKNSKIREEHGGIIQDFDSDFESNGSNVKIKYYDGMTVAGVLISCKFIRSAYDAKGFVEKFDVFVEDQKNMTKVIYPFTSVNKGDNVVFKKENEDKVIEIV